MSITNLFNIMTHTFKNRHLKQIYWDFMAFVKDAKKLLLHPDAPLRQHAWVDLTESIFRLSKPVSGQTDLRIRAVVDWLLAAQAATPDDGVSMGYFPTHGTASGWSDSYPETTGYIITSLLNFSRSYNSLAAKEAAMRMAFWETEIQMASGAVQGGTLASADKQTPAAFNTGMVLDGWCSAYQETKEKIFLEAGRKAADFLVNDLDGDGYYKTNGQFVTANEFKTYTCLCAWALYRFGLLTQEPKYQNAAITSIEAALRQQTANGWFAHNCLNNSDAPLTHTLGYTLQGILEVGLLSGREDFINAARLGLEPILNGISANGYLPGRFYNNWQPAAFYSCLTGSAQIAIVAYRLAEHTGNDWYSQKAHLLVNFLKARQTCNSKNSAINGAIAGSFPILGQYMRAGYPNWASKYFLDALMLQHKHEQNK